MIAKMNMVENDLPPTAGYAVDSFPTIILFKAKSHELIFYKGERSVELFRKFLAESALWVDCFCFCN